MGYYKIGQHYRRKRRWPYGFIIPILLVIVANLFINTMPYDNVLPTKQAETALQQLSQPAAITVLPTPEISAPMPWPEYGQAAYGVINDGVLAQSDEAAEAVPIASLTKVITALVLLDKKPLLPSEQGPIITLSEADEELYQAYVRKSGTVVPVQAGVEISQYQAMQAMLLPSANNMSDTLAIWAFGSMEAYNDYANKWLQKNQLIKTKVDGASGYSSLSVSTANEMVRLGILYLQDPLLREISYQTEANIPFAGRIVSHHAAINDGNILGLKIGYTEAAGATFLAATISGEGSDNISVAAVLGADSKLSLLRDIKKLLDVGNIEHETIEKTKP